MANWKTDSSRVIHETPWFIIREDKIRNHRDTPMTFTHMDMKNPSVSIIATDEQGRILLQRNYRHNIKKTVWEIPAGHSDGQDLLEAAKRELQEETGLGSDDWTDLGLFYIAPGVANIKQQYFLARNVHPVEGERDEDEEITEIRFFTVDEIDEMFRNNEIQSYMAPIGIAVARAKGLKGDK